MAFKNIYLLKPYFIIFLTFTAKDGIHTILHKFYNNFVSNQNNLLHVIYENIYKSVVQVADIEISIEYFDIFL